MAEEQAETKKERTWKRELATGFMGLICLHVGYYTVAVPPEHVPVYVDITRVLIWPATILVGGAFGAEWAKTAGLISPK